MSEDKQFIRRGDSKDTIHKTQEVDIYRDTFIRYMGERIDVPDSGKNSQKTDVGDVSTGYSNEIGESFRPLVPKSLVAASYGMAIGYVCTDTFDKALRLQMEGASTKEVAIKGADVFAWQMMASVAIPGLVINRITWATRSLLTRAPVAVLKTVPTLVGLVSIPLIIHPIDSLVDRLMDATFRRVVR
ncbi:mitochondrial fission process protein 1 isoform X1 [Drosophila serrata]|uniref:mitochondrial fission process protein 1 isoform X1 n=1 Tax=Drosophila serrata TaxID=7274 RepID=UPI000A1D05BF|nr:mitochondrial fission process protein 1 isoform X1 [Drosophila serrata]